MADSELPHTRASESLTLTVFRLRNLRGLRGDAVLAMIKVEWNDKTLGESVKVESTAEEPAELNYTTSITVNFDDARDLDDIAHKPILLSIIEVLPKEKRQKEEKTNLIGQCTVDLFPMLTADKSKHQQTLTIHSVPGSPIENLMSELPKPELDLQLSVNEPLVSSTIAEETNLLNVTIESVFSPPDAFQVTGQQFAYVASLPLPMNSEKETTLVFGNGAPKPGIDKELPNKQRKWLHPGTSAMPGNSSYIPNSFLSQDPIDEEDGDYKSKEDREHRTVSEQEKNRVTWNTERRCFLEASANKSLQEKIAKNRLWPVEVMRMPMPAGGKGKKDEENQVYYHGVAYVNLAPLLYPGVTRIRGAYKIYPYTDHEYQEKTRRKHGTAEEAVKSVHGQLNRGAASPYPKKGGEKDKAKTDARKGIRLHSNLQHKPSSAYISPSSNSSLVHIGKSSPSQSPHPSVTIGNMVTATQPMTSAQTKTAGPGEGGIEAEPPQNVEGQQYVENKSYLCLEVKLARPMVPKRPPQELAARVAEYIPPRPAFPKRTNGAQKAVEDFHGQVANVAQLILEEFRHNDAFEDLRKSFNATVGPKEEQRQALLYELNSSGKYFAFKEQLKHSVIKIVREKYLQTTNFNSQQQLQTFLSELYVYLVDQMHVALSKFLSLEDKTPVPKPLTDSAQLKHFAREAEVNEDFELADKYYKERIARDRLDAEHWFDYGTFNLYINDIEKAEECFKECISINQSHLNGLLLYGVVCAMEERVEAAETFFEAATNVAPNSVIAWTMLSLFYDGIENDIGAEMASIEANKKNIEQCRQQQQESLALPADVVGSAPLPLETADEKSEPADGAHQSASSSKVAGGSSRGATGKADQKKSSVNSRKRVGSASGSQLATRTKSQESLASGRPPSQSKSPIDPTPDPNAVPSAAPAVDGPAVDAPREPTPVPQSSVYMQAIDWLLEVKAIPFTERALGMQLLIASKDGGPTADYHIALARLKLQKKELPDAEEELNEALQIDYQNADAWSLMGHLKYLAGDVSEAKQCYERTLSFLTDPSETHSIYLRLASIYLQDGEFPKAKHTFLQACRSSPSCISWLGVGIACYRLDELADAEDALSEANILNNEDSEVWGYLSMVCLRTGRKLEAEQAFKYALKLNMKDQDLLTEIRQLQVKVGFGNPEL